MSKQRQGKPIGLTMVQDRMRSKRDRIKRPWALQAGGNDLDAIAEAHGLRLHRVGQGLSICICKGEWQAARFWPATQTLIFDGGQTYQSGSLEDAIGKVASVLKLD